MFPLILTADFARFTIVGNEYLAQKRLKQLQEAGIKHIDIFSPSPCHCMGETAGDNIKRRLPKWHEIARTHILYIVDIEEKKAEKLAKTARFFKTLVNVEDVIPLCDFHTPALVRRGDLLISISTNGKSPGLARRIKKRLSQLFPEEWAEKLDKLGKIRLEWRSQGLQLKEVAKKTDDFLDQEGWLEDVSSGHNRIK